MANKKVSQLVSKPSVLVTDLFPIADPTTGQLFKTTISDLGTAIGSGVSSVNTLVGAVVLDTDDIQELASPTNRWFTDTRARAALSASSPLAYNSGTGVFSIAQANGSTNGFLSSADWTTFNAKQAALSGTGFVKISGTTISYDNSTYLTTSAAASTYLALAGGTLTGALNGTSATFTGDLTLSATNPRLYFTDTDNNPDYFISNTDGTFTIYDVTASTSRLTINGTTATLGANLTATSFIKSGGTSSEFLKADGSVDSNTYLTTSSASSTYLSLAGGTMTGQIVLKEASSSTDYSKGLRFPDNPFGATGDVSGLRLYADTSVGTEAQVLELYIGNDAIPSVSRDRINFATGVGLVADNNLVTINGNIIWNAGNLTPQTQLNGTGFVKASGTTISYDNTSYLPLTGGTLTGALNGTSATFSSTVNAQSGLLLTTTQTITTAGSIGYNSTVGTFINSKAGSSFDFRLYNGVGLTVMSIPTATQSAIFSSSVALDGGDFRYRPNGDVTNSPSLILKSPTAGVLSLCAEVIGDANANSNSLSLRVSNPTNGRFDALTIASTGAATFTSSVSASGIDLTGGNWLKFGGVNTLYSNGGVGLFIQQPDGSTSTTFRSSGGNSQMVIGSGSGGGVTINNTALVKGQLTTGDTATALATSIIFQNSNNGYQFGINTACTLFQFINGAPSVVATVSGSTGVFTPLSDKNKKKDFEASTIGLKEILQLKPTLFRFKDGEENAKKDLGFIAQEVKEFIPQAYVESGEGDSIFIGLQDRPIIAALTKAIQELKIELDTLKNK